MSQCSLSKVRAAQRRRAGLVRIIARDQPGSDMTGSFDVYRARQLAITMVRGYADNVHDRRRCDQGQRLLAALAGQSSACRSCFGVGTGYPVIRGPFVASDGLSAVFDMHTPQCLVCNGTGHNLRGHLPPVEVTPQLARRCLDSHLVRTQDVRPDSWLNDLGQDVWAAAMWANECCRVVPRGEHRYTRVCGPDDWLNPDELITARGWRSRGRLADKSRLPRWRRGELLHAQQRRKKSAAKDMAYIDAGSVTADEVRQTRIT